MLNGKTALIAGGTAGIGLAVAQQNTFLQTLVPFVRRISQ